MYWGRGAQFPLGDSRVSVNVRGMEGTTEWIEIREETQTERGCPPPHPCAPERDTKLTAGRNRDGERPGGAPCIICKGLNR